MVTNTILPSVAGELRAWTDLVADLVFSDETTEPLSATVSVMARFVRLKVSLPQWRKSIHLCYVLSITKS